MSTLFTPEEVLAATGAVCVNPTHPQKVFIGVTTDSRSVKFANLFVALRGERFDGHAFLKQASDIGVTGVVVEAGHPRSELPPEVAIFEVPDTLRALGGLGRFHRQRFSIPVCAVGGSNGKTTTKEMVAAILSTRGPALSTQGNFNNEIGVPLTLFRLEPTHVAAVIELGMNHPGEVERLTDIARPQAGVVTVVQPEHLEGLGSLEGVAHAEGELYRGLPKDGIAVANLDDALAHAEAKNSGRKLITFGVDAKADVRMLGIDKHDASGIAFRIGFQGKTLNAAIPHVGEHNAKNACGAFALATALGYTPDECLRGLAQSAPANRRLNVKKLPVGATLLDDCYNANPGSMAAALDTVASLARTGRAVAVLGDMLELGAEESDAHRELGEKAAKLPLLVFFGPRSKLGAEAAKKSGAREVVHTENPDDAVALLKSKLASGDVVLVKGSRGMRMERIVAGLTGEAAGGH
ncbi:MAG: UDP-N-acetylmuramoyl-tripeptide--D-alanyl-D-alanine ligase [Deltaproteobacteria bacterium]|nr:UDP-N-acetylmuramoyl-tripeptide--D-alanyl-D-alanine ligase [Deltaproteobacteria bacterium]